MIRSPRRGSLSPGEMFPSGDAAYRVQFPRLRSGLKVRVVERGDPASPPVLFVHGWGCSVYVFRRNMPALADAGYRAMAVDLKGHGLSDKPISPDEYTIDAMVEHLRDILAASRRQRRLGVCLDTCHVHAAGYDLVTREGYEQTLDDFQRTVGLAHLHAIHVNDSKKPRGSRVDRHEHIGRGSIGEAGFANLMTDPRLSAIPKFLETPKDDALDFDRQNLATLRRLARRGRHSD